MDWSITSTYEDANHHPIAVVNGNTSRRVLQVSAEPGSAVELKALGSSDPDGNKLNYSWSFYKEASSYKGELKLKNQTEAVATVTIPENASGKTMHIILEIHDDGKPSLYAYRRVIINVE
jgi:hypothetical protein